MRFVVATGGSTGDVLPFSALSAELVRRGHEVVALGCGAHRDFLERSGAEFVEAITAEEYYEAINDPNVFHPRKGVQTVMQWIGKMLDRGIEVLDGVWTPDSTLVAHTIVMSARIFEEARGARAATVHLAPASLRSLTEQTAYAPGKNLSWAPMWLRRVIWWLIDTRMIDPHIVPELNACRAKHGLGRVSRPWQSWMNSPQRVIGLWPEWYGPVQPDWPAQLRLTDFPLYDGGDVASMDDGVRAWLDDGEPPVMLTGGTPNLDAGAFFAAGLAAAAATGRRALVAAGERVQLPALDPAAAMRAHYVPFSEALPRCAAIVHHGGIGTTSQALAAGIPQVIVPFSHDQPDNITRVMRVGAGLPAKLDRRGASVTAALRRVLSDPAIRAGAERARDNLRPRSGIPMACDLLERHAASPPPPAAGE
jgi:UDP:flavonoid glycosyltransferase YjiC (YdhE family)